MTPSRLKNDFTVQVYQKMDEAKLQTASFKDQFEIDQVSQDVDVVITYYNWSLGNKDYWNRQISIDTKASSGVNRRTHHQERIWRPWLCGGRQGCHFGRLSRRSRWSSGGTWPRPGWSMQGDRTGGAGTIQVPDDQVRSGEVNRTGEPPPSVAVAPATDGLSGPAPTSGLSPVSSYPPPLAAMQAAGE